MKAYVNSSEELYGMLEQPKTMKFVPGFEFAELIAARREIRKLDPKGQLESLYICMALEKENMPDISNCLPVPCHTHIYTAYHAVHGTYNIIGLQFLFLAPLML